MGIFNNLIGSTEDLIDYAKRNAPKLTSIGSSVLAIGACAGTGIATWKAKDKLEDHNDKLHELHMLLANAEGEEKEKIKAKIAMEYGITTLTILGYYTPPALMLAGSIACDISSSKQYEHKLAIASGSLFLLKTAWDKAQERSKEKYGEEATADIFYGYKEKEIEVKDKKGNPKIEKVKEYDPYGIVNSNPCAILLGDGIKSNLEDIDVSNDSMKNNKLWNNLNFLRYLERKYTYELNSKGYVYVKDIYKELGVEAMSPVQEDLWNYWGWFKDSNKISNVIANCKENNVDPYAIDIESGLSPIQEANSIKLGIDSPFNENYRLGYEPMVWIVPNCIGDITELRFPNSKKQLQSFKEVTAN